MYHHRANNRPSEAYTKGLYWKPACAYRTWTASSRNGGNAVIPTNLDTKKARRKAAPHHHEGLSSLDALV
jgi:hypothetical protein